MLSYSDWISLNNPPANLILCLMSTSHNFCLAVLTKRPRCLGDLVHSKVQKKLAYTAWVPKLSDLLQSQLNLNFTCRKLMSLADIHSLVLFCFSIHWADILENIKSYWQLLLNVKCGGQWRNHCCTYIRIQSGK